MSDIFNGPDVPIIQTPPPQETEEQLIQEKKEEQQRLSLFFSSLRNEGGAQELRAPTSRGLQL